MYKIGLYPDLDSMADYLAAFVKLKYNRKRLTMVGISYGLNVATRMLQKYPELSKKVDLLISLVGFVHYEEFKYKPLQLQLLRFGTRIFSYRIPAWIAKVFFLRSPFIIAAYTMVARSHAKMKDADAQERKRRINFEIFLWKCNDIRTYMYTINGMFHVDLCDKRVKLPIHHVSVAGDQYFDNYKVEQHMRVIFEDYKEHKAIMNAHMPTIVATSKEIAPLIPKSLRRLLAKSS
jgi:pimeloyl-ACP methyl ester carboxylesterase